MKKRDPIKTQPISLGISVDYSWPLHNGQYEYAVMVKKYEASTQILTSLKTEVGTKLFQCVECLTPSRPSFSGSDFVKF